MLPDGSLGRVQTAHGPLNCPTPAWVTEGSEVLVVFRPEILRISVDAPDDQTNVLEGSLVSASFVGDVVDYQVEVGDRLFNAKGDPFESIDPGTKVYLSIPGSRCFLVSAADPVAAVSAADQAEAVAAAAPGENATS